MASSRRSLRLWLPYQRARLWVGPESGSLLAESPRWSFLAELPRWSFLAEPPRWLLWAAPRPPPRRSLLVGRLLGWPLAAQLQRLPAGPRPLWVVRQCRPLWALSHLQSAWVPSRAQPGLAQGPPSAIQRLAWPLLARRCSHSSFLRPVGLAALPSSALSRSPPPRPVLPRPVLPRPVLPRPVLPRPVLPRPVLPRPVLPRPVLPRPVLPRPVLPRPVLPRPVLPRRRLEPAQAPFVVPWLVWRRLRVVVGPPELLRERWQPLQRLAAVVPNRTWEMRVRPRFRRHECRPGTVCI